MLVFVGRKIFWAQLYGKVEPLVSLGVTGVLLGCGVACSLYRTRAPAADPSPHSPGSNDAREPAR